MAFGKEFLYLKTGRVLKNGWGGGGRERGGGACFRENINRSSGKRKLDFSKQEDKKKKGGVGVGGACLHGNINRSCVKEQHFSKHVLSNMQQT